LNDLPKGSKIALETSGCYYWTMDEREHTAHFPQMAHALTANRRMEGRHETNDRMRRGRRCSLRHETVAVVRIPPAAPRDQRDRLPCVGKILSAVMALEIGDVRRFPGPDLLVSYAGVVPVARESANWKRKDKCPHDCNVYPKWAYVEAANLISAHRKRND